MIEISWKALGAALVFLAALIYVALVVAHRFGKRAGVEEYLDEKRVRRYRRHRAARIAAGTKVRGRLEPFPGDTDELFERLPADTGELRELSEMAETGELDRIKAENAAFFRLLALREWTRKRESAA